MLMKSKKSEQLASAGVSDKYSKLANAVDRDNDDFIQAQVSSGREKGSLSMLT